MMLFRLYNKLAKLGLNSSVQSPSIKQTKELIDKNTKN